MHLSIRVFAAFFLIAAGASALVIPRDPIDAVGASNSPGALSGNVLQVPANVPINVCGNSVNVIGLLNPAFGNNCENHSENL